MRTLRSNLCPRSLAALCAASLIVCGFAGNSLAVVPYSNDFNSGNDIGFTHYEPLAASGVPGAWSFPNGAYNISAPVSPDFATVGVSRAGSIALGASTADFVVAADIMDFDNAFAGQYAAVLARVTQPGLFTTDGYLARYNPFSSTFPGQSTIVINRILDEQYAAESTLMALPRDLTKDYRIVFSGTGPDFNLKLFDLGNLASPVANLDWTDISSGAFSTSGATGMFAGTLNTAVGVNATFDNFSVGAAPVPEPASLLGAIAGVLLLRRRHWG